MNARTSGALPSDVDLIVLGSGAGGLTAALTAQLAGLQCLLLEHQDVIGGTSARSSGTVWVPDNRAMRAAGRAEDRIEAEHYLEALVSGRSERAAWEAFLDAAPRMQSELEDRVDLSLTPMPAAPDYRQDLPGAASGWRAMEPGEFDGRRLGVDFLALAQPLRELMLFGGMMIKRSEVQRALSSPFSPQSIALLARLCARYALDLMRWPRGTRLVMGNALIACLLFAALNAGVIVRRNVSTEALTKTGDRVSGIRTRSGEAVIARLGVILAGGGFPASASWRKSEMPEPTPDFTPASGGCTGATIELGLAAGGVLGPSLQDNALWFPSSVGTRQDGSQAVYPHIVLDRAKPGSIVVDHSARRFTNEAISYHEFVRAMYRANESGTSIPAWMICDSVFLRRYGLGMIRPRAFSIARYVASGYLKTSPTLEQLASNIGLPEAQLVATVARANRFAECGKDEDFGRGETIYDRSNGDPKHGPNPCLGRIASAPFYAVELHPTPLGSSRGLASDTHARVLSADGAPVAGLYVCGNDMQSAFGGEYPGAGAQLGQAMTFGWIAARHAASA